MPLPDWFPAEGNAASSLRSTAADLARFLIDEIAARALGGKAFWSTAPP